MGVAGGEINRSVVEALKKEYDLLHANVTFKDVAPTDLRRAVQAKEVAAVIVVVPLTDKYLSLVKGLFREGANTAPVLIPIDSAGRSPTPRGLTRASIFPRAHCADHRPFPTTTSPRFACRIFSSPTAISTSRWSPNSPSASWPHGGIWQPNSL